MGINISSFLHPLIKSLRTKQNIWSLRVSLNNIKNVLLFFFNVYKNERKEHKFWWKKKQKSEFYENKKVFQIDDIDVSKIQVSKIEPYGTKNALKYFTGYNDNDVIRPLCVRLPQMTGYAKNFNENTTMSFRGNNKQLLKNYDKTWEKLKSY